MRRPQINHLHPNLHCSWTCNIPGLGAEECRDNGQYRQTKSTMGHAASGTCMLHVPDTQTRLCIWHNAYPPVVCHNSSSPPNHYVPNAIFLGGLVRFFNHPRRHVFGAIFEWREPSNMLSVWHSVMYWLMSIGGPRFVKRFVRCLSRWQRWSPTVLMCAYYGSFAKHCIIGSFLVTDLVLCLFFLWKTSLDIYITYRSGFLSVRGMRCPLLPVSVCFFLFP